MKTQINQPTTLKCYVTNVKKLRVDFVANFGEGTGTFWADLPEPTYLGGVESISNLDEGRKILFKITLQPGEHWTISSLVRQSDNVEFIGSKPVSKYAYLDDELL